jgi:hypothetical protein
VNRAQQVLKMTEKFSFAFKNPQWDAYVEVFENPISKDFQQFNKQGELRFIANNRTKKMYVFGSDVAIHDQVMSKMKFPYIPDILLGEASFRGGKWMMIDSDYTKFKGGANYARSQQKMDWSWAEKYISNINGFLSRVRR